MTGDGSERDAGRGDAGDGPDDPPDDGYVHRPTASGDGPDADAPTASDDGPDRTTAAYLQGEGGGEADWRARLLVVATFVAFLVVPGVILVLPAARPAIAAFGLTYRDAYLVLPLVPALVLAGLAVWAGVANRRRR